MSLAQTAWADLDYVEVLFGVIIAWVLIALWQRVVENAAYTTLKLNPKSTFHALLVAVVMTAIFLVLISSVNSIAEGILVGATSSTPATSTGSSNSASLAVAAKFQQGEIPQMKSNINRKRA